MSTKDFTLGMSLQDLVRKLVHPKVPTGFMAWSYCSMQIEEGMMPGLPKDSEEEVK